MKPHLLLVAILVLVSCVFVPGLLLAETLGEESTGRVKSFLPSSLPIPAQVENNPRVAILILENQNRFPISIPFPYKVLSTEGSFSEPALSSSDVTLTNQGIAIGNQFFTTPQITIATGDRYFELGKRSYRGNLSIIQNSKGALNAVNEVQIEDYLKGVLAWEVNSQWPEESLKAQAVASRTFALFKFLEHAKEKHMLTSGVLSQVYAGKNAEKIFTNRAVDLTEGEILTFGGNIFPAFFHSACGGHTTEAERAWRIQPNFVLRGVVCPYCRKSKHYEWQVSVPLEKIQSQLASQKFTISPIQNITFTDYDASGRAQKVSVRHQKGELKLDANDFRLFIDPDLIRSTKASVKVSGKQAHFSGLGWGHGVGMCQWGAKTQAEAGKTYQQILAFYYPGSEVVKLYGTNKSESQVKSAGNQSDDLSLIEKAEKLMNDWIG